MKQLEKQEENRSVGVINGHLVSVQYRFPLPPPDLIDGYKRIDKEAPKLIMDLFVKQMNHRIDCEKLDLESKIATRKLGQLFGFFFSLLSIITGTIAVCIGNTVVSSIIFGTTIPFCAVVFVVGREPKKNASTSKQDK